MGGRAIQRQPHAKGKTGGGCSSQCPTILTGPVEDEREKSVTEAKMIELMNGGARGQQALQMQALIDKRTEEEKLPFQRMEDAKATRNENKTGLPDSLKTGIENLSGYSMDDVRVHYNSSKPAQLQAHAYAQGSDIHLGPVEDKRKESVAQAKMIDLMNNSTCNKYPAYLQGSTTILSPEKNRQQAQEFHTSSPPPIQRKTIIEHKGRNWGRPNAADIIVGHRMRAKLDNDHPVQGSEPPRNSDMGGVRNQIRRNNGEVPMVLGHLLNHDLGGLGINTNLIPITWRANGQHYRLVESRVKHALYGNHQIQPRPQGGPNSNAYHVEYEVDAISPEHRGPNVNNPYIRFDCRFRRVNRWNFFDRPIEFENWQNTTIHSTPSELIGNAHPVNIPQAWEHNGHGLGGISTAQIINGAINNPGNFNPRQVNRINEAINIIPNTVFGNNYWLSFDRRGLISTSREQPQ